MKNSNLRRLLYSILSIVTTASLLLSCNSKPEKLPNIIIIFADDQGYQDLGCYGAVGFETPNIDKLAAEGMRFTDFYASQAVCSASRSSLLTGCYAERVSISGALMPSSKKGLNPNEETIAELLKKENYATAIFGKWHLGHDTAFLPTNHGFDEFFGLPYSNDMWPVLYDGSPDTSNFKKHYPKLFLIDGIEKVEEVKTLDDQAKLTTLYTERAVEFIKNNHDKPFFLYLPHSMPHVPLGVSDKFKGKSKQGLYGDVIMEIDWSVGQIMQALEDYGIGENTLVIYTSDNGPWLNYGNHAGSALPLREGKGSMWEGGTRVPCIMRWPGHIPRSSTCHKLATTIDILPTIGAITGIELSGNEVDGVSILPLMENIKDVNPRDSFYYYYGKELRAVRKGNWKLNFPHSYRSYKGVEAGKDGFPGKYSKGTCGLELYNLRKDIGETNNVALENPLIVEELQEIAEMARTDLGDKLTGRKGIKVREPGRLRAFKDTVIFHKGLNTPISIVPEPNIKYAAEGGKTLLDGKMGSYDCTDGRWLGFFGDNMEAIIDLRSISYVKSIGANFLQDQPSWIFLPESVCYSTSGDGFNYSENECLDNELISDNISLVKRYQFNVYDSVRYIRLEANNIGKCPDWHHGYGGNAWIFIDEIIID